MVARLPALPDLAAHARRLFQHLLANADRRPAVTHDVLVQVLAGAHAEEESSRHQRGGGGCGLRHDHRVNPHRRARHAGAHAQAVSYLGDTAEHAPHEGTVALFVHPRMEVVGDEREGEPGLLGLTRLTDEIARPELFAGQLVPELHHATRVCNPVATDAGGSLGLMMGTSASRSSLASAKRAPMQST